MPELDAQHRAQLAETLREVRIGPIGPNALAILERGGWTHLNGSERDAAADALAPLVAGWLADAWDEGWRSRNDDYSAGNPYRAVRPDTEEHHHDASPKSQRPQVGDNRPIQPEEAPDARA